VVLPVSDESVVPEASKNTRNGEMPVPRTAFTFSVNGPFVAEHDEPLGGLTGDVTVTVADC
jgi:hypothetical protein